MRASDSSNQSPSWRARVQPGAVALPGMTGGAPVNHRSSLRHSTCHSAQTPQHAPQPARSAVRPPVEETEERGRIEEFDEYLRAIGADDFIDPISQEPIDPDKLVTSRYGHMYDRDSVSEYLQRNPTCPFTRGPLTVNDLFPNFKLKADLVKHRRDFERQKQAPRQENAPRPASATVPAHPTPQPLTTPVPARYNPFVAPQRPVPQATAPAPASLGISPASRGVQPAYSPYVPQQVPQQTWQPQYTPPTQLTQVPASGRVMDTRLGDSIQLPDGTVVDLRGTAVAGCIGLKVMDIPTMTILAIHDPQLRFAVSREQMLAHQDNHRRCEQGLKEMDAMYMKDFRAKLAAPIQWDGRGI